MLESTSKPIHPNTKPKRVRRKPKPKNFDSLIEYGDPDTKVVVRLLPPTLEQTDFLEQAKKNSPTLQSGYKSLTYKQGTNAAQPFEEPNFSLAFVKFQSRESAEMFKQEISQMLFKEPKTGDNIKCSTVKPIFGELSVALKRQSDESLKDGEVFKLFTELREKNEGYVDINDAINLMKASIKQKKVKLKQQKKKIEKSKVPPPKKSNTPLVENQLKPQIKKNPKTSGNPKDLPRKGGDPPISGEDKKEKNPKKLKKLKPKRKPGIAIDVVKNVEAEPLEIAVSNPKPPKKKPKNKKKKLPAEVKTVPAQSEKQRSTSQLRQKNLDS